MTDFTLICGDCLDVVPAMPPRSVDAIITDVPYGTTQCSWDSIIPFVDLWRIVKHVLKPGGVFVTTASQPFTSLLVCSNLEWFRQELVWDKVLPVGFLDANRKHMRRHENILIFSAVGGVTYNPIMQKREIRRSKGNSVRKDGQVYGDYKRQKSENNTYYPTSILSFSNGDRTRPELVGHPTQKPVSLYSYLVQTYTNPGETVLDFTMGSGTTGISCALLNRNFIGVEKDPGYFEIASKRINAARSQMILPLDV